jgi:hypothetical protein
VPCPGIGDADGYAEWGYEADDIIRYLKKTFAAAGSAPE